MSERTRASTPIRSNLRTNLPNYVNLSKLFATRRDRVWGAFLEVALAPEDGYVVTPGIRLDSFGSGDEQAFAVDPRIAARFEVSPSLRIGPRVRKRPPDAELRARRPGVHLAGLRDGLQTSWQASSGFRGGPARGRDRVDDGLRKHFTRLSDPLGVSGDFFAHPETAYIRSLGSAVGLELSARRALTHRLGGILSYTLSRNTRKHGRIDTLAAIDRPHVEQYATNERLRT